MTWTQARTTHVHPSWKISSFYRGCRHIIECLSNMVAVSKQLGLAFQNPRPCQQLGEGEEKEEKRERKNQEASKVKFKDVFLLDAHRHCHKPRETFSYSTFFMVSLGVSSLPLLSTLAPAVPTAALPGQTTAGGAMGSCWKPCCETPPPPRPLPPRLQTEAPPVDPRLVVFGRRGPSEWMPPGWDYLGLLSSPLLLKVVPCVHTLAHGR